MSDSDAGMSGAYVAAVMMHEMYESYVRAGFSRRQAFELVKVHVMAASRVDQS